MDTDYTTVGHLIRYFEKAVATGKVGYDSPVRFAVLTEGEEIDDVVPFNIYGSAWKDNSIVLWGA